MTNATNRIGSGRNHAAFFGFAGSLALGCVCLATGCMHMETQRTTLEHKPQVVTPEDSQGSRLVVVPEERVGR